MRTTYVIENVKQDGEVKSKQERIKNTKEGKASTGASSRLKKRQNDKAWNEISQLSFSLFCRRSSFGFRTKDVCGCVLDGGWWQ